MSDYTTFTAPVTGGSIHGGVWNPGALGEPVLAIHGITASRLAWPFVAERLTGIRLIAPDLRGRARSNQLPPPWSMTDHADDMARVLDALHLNRAVVVGHSMGAFVAVRFAAQYPDRVSSLLLVDGGLPLATRDDIPNAEMALQLLGPAAERLTRLYPDRETYIREWQQHPSLRDHWNDRVRDYVNYDLDEAPGGFRSSARLEAILTNIVQQGAGGGYQEALAGLTVPVEFIRSPRGLLNEVPPLYPISLVQSAQAVLPALIAHEAIDVNHYTIVMSDEGAEQVAPLVRAQVAAAGEAT